MATGSVAVSNSPRATPSQVSAVLQRLVEIKAAHHWSGNYFSPEKAPPLTDVIAEQKLAPRLAELVERHEVFSRERFLEDRATRREYSTFLLPRRGSPGGQEFADEVLALAKRSRLADDKVFLGYLEGLAGAVHGSGGFKTHSAQELALALFGHAVAEYELMREMRLDDRTIMALETYNIYNLADSKSIRMESFVDGLIREVRGIGLKEAEDAMPVRPRGEEPLPEETENRRRLIRHARLQTQKITLELLDYLQKNYGLVFVSQEYVKSLDGKSTWAPEYRYHTEPAFRNTNHGDVVCFYFGAPFLPLAPASKTSYVEERDSVVKAMRKLADTIKHRVEEPARFLSFRDDATGRELEEHPLEFGKRLESYAELLLPVSRYYRTGGQRDWSFPTFSFDEQLKAEYEKLLRERGHELPEIVVREIQLTLRVMDARRKLFAEYRDYNKDGLGRWQIGHSWEKIVRSIFPDPNEPMYKLTMPTINRVSMVLLGHPEALKRTKALNEAGIGELLGYTLPES